MSAEHGHDSHGGGHGHESGGGLINVLSSPFEAAKTAVAGVQQLFSGLVNGVLSLLGGGGGGGSHAAAHGHH